MRPAILLILAMLAPPAAAQDRCWVLCDEEIVLEGAEGAARLEAWLEEPLPARTEVEGYREGGFQDAILWVRLDVDAAGLDALLDAIGGSVLRPELSESVAKDPGDPSWWDWHERVGVKFAEGGLPRLPYATLRAAPVAGAPGRWTVWLVAFQT